MYQNPNCVPKYISGHFDITHPESKRPKTFCFALNLTDDEVCMCQLLVVAVDETWHWIALSLSPTTPPTPAGPHPHQSSSASKPHPSQYFPSMVISCRNQPLMDGEHSKNKKSLWGRRYIEGNVWNRCHEYFIRNIQIQSHTHFSRSHGKCKYHSDEKMFEMDIAPYPWLRFGRGVFFRFHL